MEGEGVGPQAAPPDVSPFLCEDFINRLRLLRYEEQYCLPRDMAPFHKYQFSSAGSGNQFPAFVGIVSWLLVEARRRFAVDRFDDPTTVLTKLVAELRAMGAPPEVMDFQPLKLRTGCGEAPCRILLFCAEAALAARGFKWSRPTYPEETCVSCCNHPHFRKHYLCQLNPLAHTPHTLFSHSLSLSLSLAVALLK